MFEFGCFVCWVCWLGNWLFWLRTWGLRFFEGWYNIQILLALLLGLGYVGFQICGVWDFV